MAQPHRPRVAQHPPLQTPPRPRVSPPTRCSLHLGKDTGVFLNTPAPSHLGSLPFPLLERSLSPPCPSAWPIPSPRGHPSHDVLLEAFGYKLDQPDLVTFSALAAKQHATWLVLSFFLTLVGGKEELLVHSYNNNNKKPFLKNFL